MYAIIVVCILGFIGLVVWLTCHYVGQILYLWWVLSCRARRSGYEEIPTVDDV